MKTVIVMKKIKSEYITIPSISEILLRKNRRIARLEKQLGAVKHHFEHHDCMYVFDFNTLMDENSSEFVHMDEIGGDNDG